MKVCVWLSHIPLRYLRPSSPAFVEVIEPLFQAEISNTVPETYKLVARVHMEQMRLQSASKQHNARIRSELSVHTTAIGFRKEVGCTKTHIPVRFKRKITLPVKTLSLHVPSQYFPIRVKSILVSIKFCVMHFHGPL